MRTVTSAMRVVLGGTVVLALLTGMSAAFSTMGASSRAAAAPVVTIGWAGPLSGDQKYFGRSWLNGVKMAAQDFAFSGPLKGSTVKVIAMDDAADPARGAAVARRLVKAGVVGVVADFNSGVTLASQPIYHRANLPQVTVSSSPQITARGYRNVVQLNENDNFQGGQMAIFAVTKLHIKSVGVFNDGLAFGRGVSGLFLSAARSRGVNIIGRNTTLGSSQAGYVRALSPILAKHPQAIYFGGTAIPGGRLCRLVRARGFTGPFLGPDGLYTPDFVRGCGPKVGAAYVTTSAPPYGSTAALRAFAAAYERRFGSPPGPYSVYGHDEAGYLLTAINAAGRSSGPAAVSKLHGMTYRGVLGLEKINASGQLLNAPNYVYQVKAGGFIAVYSNRGV